jgi:hypothetical protein
LDLDSVFTINDPDVIADSIQGETLIINLHNGLYYSTDGSGDEIWRHLQEHQSVAEVIAVLTARYAADPGTIRDEVVAFISELRADGLIIKSKPVPPSPPASESSETGEVLPFAKPVLQRYTDYQELLLLDPIHEVVESAGWPVAKPQAGA